MTNQAHNKGVRGEQLAIDELLRLGYHVYRSITYQAPFDLVAEKENQLFRVEVKARTGYDPHFDETMSKHLGKWDILAIVDLRSKHVNFRHGATGIRPCGVEGLPEVNEAAKEKLSFISPQLAPEPLLKVGEKNHWGDVIYALSPEED